ncbi:MAG: suppressor of fused domain protein [Verrucomicrobiota bacterium]
MSVSQIAKEVYHAHVDHFGEPADSWKFDDGKRSDVFPDRIDVMFWPTDADCGISTFATVGMSDRPMVGANYRVELHFSLRLSLQRAAAAPVARFLANLAMYPFQIGAALDWWHTISQPGPIPFFREASCVLLHPHFVPNGWDAISTKSGDVRILNVVPITPAEKALKMKSRIADALSGIDVFSPR